MCIYMYVCVCTNARAHTHTQARRRSGVLNIPTKQKADDESREAHILKSTFSAAHALGP
jgi:hypothetical protein